MRSIKATKTRWMFALATVLFISLAGDVMAQPRRTPARPMVGGFEPFLEASGTYGHMWGGSIDLSYGTIWNSRKIRTGTGSSFGFQLAYNLHPMQAVEISYNRQDGKVDYDYLGLTTLFDMSVNQWHIGSVRYLAPGKVRPFVLASLGATHFSPSQATFVIDGETFRTQTSTKFSLNFGLGFKAYFGQAEKIGLRATFKAMPTLYNTGAGLWFGSGGGGLTVTGNAIWQWEIAGGLTVKFG